MNVIQKGRIPECLMAHNKALGTYRLSSFCIVKKIDDGHLLCNAATGSLIKLSDAEYSAMEQGRELPLQLSGFLISNLFIVDKAKDEYKLVDEERNREDGGNGDLCSFTIVPTSRCNARCFYCYENGIKPRNMSSQTADDVVKYIVKSCGHQPVHLSWFGGEPTLSHHIISQICNGLTEKGIVYHSSMISNGLLLKKDLAGTAEECWHLEHVQITIDGTEEIYNRTKNYKGNTDNAYRIILENISDLLERKIRVSVRINLGFHNYEDIKKLISELETCFKESEQFSIYVHEIDGIYDSDRYMELLRRVTELNILILQKNLNHRWELPAMRYSSCMADNHRSCVINPDGELSKCEHYIFDKLYGSIYKEEQDHTIIQAWKQKDQFELCGSCPFYAACVHLSWCNGGGYQCNETIVHNKLKITQEVMCQKYKEWQRQKDIIRNRSRFQLSCRLETRQRENERMVQFARKDKSAKEEFVTVNNTAFDIITFLQNSRTFGEIVEMLHQKYDVNNFPVEDIVEGYLNHLIRAGVCGRSLLTDHGIR